MDIQDVSAIRRPLEDVGYVRNLVGQDFTRLEIDELQREKISAGCIDSECAEFVIRARLKFRYVKIFMSCRDLVYIKQDLLSGGK